MPEIINDPENYRKMCEPFASANEANAALEAFFADVRAARKKHRIANVLMVAELRVNYPETGEGSAMVHGFNGDVLMAVPLAAFAYGKTQEEQRQLINNLAAGKGLQAR